MRHLVLTSLMATLLVSCMDSSPMHPGVSGRDAKAYAAAVADTSRPAADSARDVDRKPAETLGFAHIRPGDKVADFSAGGGYFTRLFVDVVGPKGHVYATEPMETRRYNEKDLAELQNFSHSHTNLTLSGAPALESLKFPEPLDVFWISQNYHDLKDKFYGPIDTAAFNQAVFAALKPGGEYIVLDHAAAAGASPEVTETLHRIDPAVVRREVEAAGFKFEAQSTILANPADSHTLRVFDPAIRGKTDQFLYRFRKPKV